MLNKNVGLHVPMEKKSQSDLECVKIFKLWFFAMQNENNWKEDLKGHSHEISLPDYHFKL
jgi:hypothetical protein